jgi:hypothetical protein
MLPVITADRLYSISVRPQELDLYGDALTFALRYAPMIDAPDEQHTTHFKILVVEVTARISPEDRTAFGGHETLQVAKCGWEVELTTSAPAVTATLVELPEELPLLLNRIAATINDLARRARIPEPLGTDIVTQLIYQYRTQGVGS